MANTDRPSLSIVIPVYNEPENITHTIRALEETIAVPHEILIVFDFDEDTTVPVVRSVQRENPSVHLVKNSIARGPSGAIRTGFAQSRADRVLVMMADLCDDINQIPQLMDLVPAEADIACPSRFCDGGAQLIADSLKSRAPRIAGRFLQMLTGMPTVDPTNSFKMYSGPMLRSLRLSSRTSFSVTLEVVAKAHCLGYRIVELPTTWTDRVHGETKFKLGRSLLVYIRWFALALVRNRLFRVPESWLSPIIGAEGKAAPDTVRTS